MKLFLVGLAFVAAAVVSAIASEPVDSLSVLEEIETLQPSGVLAQDGYRYRAVRRLRHRRDVDEAQYLPPVQELALPEPNNQYLAPVEAVEPIEQLADDGYRYKTVKRLRHRNRRDVSELSSAQYLPPVQQEAGYSYPAPAPVEVAAPVVAPVEVPAPIELPAPIEAVEPVQETAELAADGYRYKTVKRIRYRKRRDVNELPSSDYLPPAELAVAEPVNQYLAPTEVSEPIEQLADDGYRYKTVKKLRYRNRRDVSEIVSNDYLPPVQAKAGYSYPAPAPVVVEAPVEVEVPAPVEIAAPVVVEQSAELANDGYRYKTVRRIRYRHRRDVNELPAEYLPPVQELAISETNNQYLAPIEAVEPIEQLADDGYRYKTVKRLRHRNRRDVSELASAEYLPPVQQKSGYSYPAPVAVATPVEIPAPVEVAAPAPIQLSAPVAITAPLPVSGPAPAVEVQQSAELANDGYRYKTVRRIRYRHRRDVNEIPSNDYLPPVVAAPAPVAVQAGYSYPAPAPVEVAAPVQVEAPVEIEAPVEESAALADDGYRYKTVRRIRYRHRRDVSELPAEYLPPVQELALPEPNNQYLAPIEAVEPIEQLADDGYRYKTVKRLRHRNRRDVNELPSADYLPPVQAVQPEQGYGYSAPAPVEVSLPAPVSAPIEVAAPIEVPAPVEPSVELASDGYRYKTVKRIRYRTRRDVNELLSGEYLPPGQEVPLPEISNEYLAPAVSVEQPIEPIAVDGYRYKTVKKYKIKRH